MTGDSLKSGPLSIRGLAFNEALNSVTKESQRLGIKHYAQQKHLILKVILFYYFKGISTQDCN